MNTRFAVPAAVALTLHATLLLGSRHSNYVRPTKTPAEKAPVWPPLVMQPETIEIVPSTSASACAAPGVTRPELPDTLSPIERPDFVMDPRPPTTVTIDKKMIAIGDPGVPGGVPGGIGVDPGSILPAGMLDNPPHTRTQVSPAYPFEAQKAGLTGTVWVEFVVDTSGYVHDPVAVRSTDRVFEAASVRAVSRWRFEPGKRDGRPVSFRMVVPVVFNLTEE